MKGNINRYKEFSLGDFYTNVVYKPIWVLTPTTANEYVYDLTLNNKIRVRLYTSIHKSTDTTISCGKDAVRIVVFSSNDIPIDKATCYRTKNCFANIKKKVSEFYSKYNTLKLCTNCKNGHLVEREGQYGKFLGCTNYKNHV